MTWKWWRRPPLTVQVQDFLETDHEQRRAERAALFGLVFTAANELEARVNALRAEATALKGRGNGVAPTGAVAPDRGGGADPEPPGHA